MTHSIFFDLPHLYYLPQYTSTIEELQRRGVQCQAVIYRGSDTARKLKAVTDLGMTAETVDNEEQAKQFYIEKEPDWIVFGNDFSGTEQLPDKTKTALLFHGSDTSIKSATLSPGLGNFDVRFISGPGRIEIFRKHFPNVTLVEAGFAKLDPICTPAGIEKNRLNLAELGLDPSKKTILYAPTFYPSSIENVPSDFPEQFSQYNILIKCHDFTLTKPRYAKQLQKLLHWQKATNVYLANPAEYTLVPFMGTADILVTDTSSAIFEFAALNKPVIICGFIKLRWTYRGPLRYRLRRRLDPSTQKYLGVAAHARRFQDLSKLLAEHLQNPKLLETERLRHSEEIMGKMDGKCSQRIVNYLLEKQRV